MSGLLCVVSVSTSLACALGPLVPGKAADELSGSKAMEHVAKIVSFGPRPPDSDPLRKARQYVVDRLRESGYGVEEDAFEAVTPYGPKKMINLIARREGAKGDAVVLATHYDTKYMPGFSFVGANDGGSGTGLLLELARVLASKKSKLDSWFVFLDGEEAFIEWSTFDSTYGSRHLAHRWQQDGTVKRIRALILLDMIGDRDLDLLRDGNSTRWLRELVWQTGHELGFEKILAAYETRVEDDHIPFIDAGIPSVDLIDLNYGPGGSYWHTAEDTLDKLSAGSLETIGRLVMAVLEKLNQKFGG